jgi:hypothetical protein
MILIFISDLYHETYPARLSMPDYAAGFRYNMLTPFAMNKNHYVVGLGEILWDKFGETKRLGGAPANFAYHASRFGHEGLVVSAIGNDGDGDDIVAELERKRLAHHLERVDSPTGTVDVDLTDANNPVYTINTDVAWSVFRRSSPTSIPLRSNRNSRCPS